MKLITAIAALALLAGSMDVEAQKRKPDGPPGGGKKPRAHQKAPEGAETGHPHISPVAHLAIGVFGELDPEERKGLAEAAGEGDEEALEELRAEHVEAIESMIEALEDEESRKLIVIGMMLAHNEGVSAGDKITAPESGAALSTIGGSQRAQDAATALSGAPGAAISDPLDHSFMNEDLDNIQEQLEAQLQHWSAWGMDGHTD